MTNPFQPDEHQRDQLRQAEATAREIAAAGGHVEPEKASPRDTQKRLSDHYAKTDTRPEPQTLEQQATELEKAGEKLSPNMRMQLGYLRNNKDKDTQE